MEKLKFLQVFIGIFFLLCFLPSSFSRRGAKRILAIDRYENCDDEKYVMDARNFTFTRRGTEILVNGIIEIQRDTKKDVSIDNIIMTCKNELIHNPDTCYVFTNWYWHDPCFMMNASPFANNLLKATEPRLPCPFKKNLYRVKDAKFTMDLVDNMFHLSANGMDEPLWKVRSEIKEEQKTVIGCVHVFFRFKYIRV